MRYPQVSHVHSPIAAHSRPVALSVAAHDSPHRYQVNIRKRARQLSAPYPDHIRVAIRAIRDKAFKLIALSALIF
jgi:hypothetical protein